ncbi:hypothetical protein ABZ897_01105 [Nonomuraea sp. NPDC046802]|uniref:hypothetical protein n=1 Tax=Nonomuraea sp. NPDC046802 TaxID=3154919 RepID=UPI0033E37444
MTAPKLVDDGDYTDPGHPGVWPGGELPAMRIAYDDLLAEQTPGSSYPVERTR